MPSQTEKRLFRTRNKCPKPLQENLGRAMSETMHIQHIPKPLSNTCLIDFLADTSRRDELDLVFRLAGSTGNVYTVNIGEEQTCTCPNFLKRDDVCKHIMYTLVKVVGLPQSSKLVYQKGLLCAELVEVHRSLSKTKSSAGTKPKSSTKKRCGECHSSIESNQGVVVCPSSSCRMTYHEVCLDIVPSFGRLTLSCHHGKHHTNTTLVKCPNCHTEFHHDEGYENVAHTTGQSRRRDHSSYRPCPGYPGYTSKSRSSYY